jgi:integrase/recombinase XerC
MPVSDATWAKYRSWALTHGQALGTASKAVRYLRFFEREKQLELEELTQDRALEFLATWRERGVKPRTLNSWVRELNLWSRFRGLGWKVQYFRHHDVPHVQVPDRELVDKIRSMRWADPGTTARNRAILALLSDMGPRRAELVALTWRDVIETPTGTVLMVRHGKGEKERQLWVDESTGLLLREYATHYRVASDPSALFTSGRGRLTYQYLGKIVKEAGARAGAPWLSCHKLRHFVADSLLDSGVSVPSVAEVLGHARWETTALYRSKRLTKIRAEQEVRSVSQQRFGKVRTVRKEQGVANRDASCLWSGGSTGI